MAKRLLLVDDQGDDQARDLRWEELVEVLDSLLGQLAQHNQGQRDLLALVEEHLVQAVWALAGYNQSRAARLLGVPRKRVERRMRKYAKEPEGEFRS
ncbi:MAG: hypothetical protein HYW07_04080 [Candidatus Latescibacteria bacterium]|nr:hypothetical protein [Candidatus Latescibacterota bacterium]